MIKSYSLFKESNDSILSIIRDLQSEIEIEFDNIDIDLTESKDTITLLIWKNDLVNIEFDDKFHYFLISRIDMIIDMYDIKIKRVSLAIPDHSGHPKNFDIKRIDYITFQETNNYIGVDIIFNK